MLGIFLNWENCLKKHTRKVLVGILKKNLQTQAFLKSFTNSACTTSEL